MLINLGPLLTAGDLIRDVFPFAAEMGLVHQPFQLLVAAIGLLFRKGFRDARGEVVRFLEVFPDSLFFGLKLGVGWVYVPFDFFTFLLVFFFFFLFGLFFLFLLSVNFFFTNLFSLS